MKEKRKTGFYLCSLAAFLLAGSVQGAEIHVPAEQLTIQGGIRAAADGDTVIVSSGTYHELVDFEGKAITVRSTDPSDPEIVAATIVDGDIDGDGEGDGTVFTFDSGEGGNSVLSGFTIQNGYAENGAGIGCWSSSPTIRGNILKGNTAYMGGGAIYCANASPMLIDDIIGPDNTAGYGGGIYLVNSASPTMINSVVMHNSAA